MNYYEILYENSYEVAYHVAPSEKTNNILSNGIIKGKRSEGIYVWKNLKYARFFAMLESDSDINEHPKAMTIWKLNISGIDKKIDSETLDMSEFSSKFEQNEFGEGYILLTNFLPPEKIIEVVDECE